MGLRNSPLLRNDEVSKDLGGIVAGEDGGDLDLLCDGYYKGRDSNRSHLSLINIQAYMSEPAT